MRKSPRRFGLEGKFTGSLRRTTVPADEQHFGQLSLSTFPANEHKRLFNPYLHSSTYRQQMIPNIAQLEFLKRHSLPSLSSCQQNLRSGPAPDGLTIHGPGLLRLKKHKGPNFSRTVSGSMTVEPTVGMGLSASPHPRNSLDHRLNPQWHTANSAINSVGQPYSLQYHWPLSGRTFNNYENYATGRGSGYYASQGLKTHSYDYTTYPYMMNLQSRLSAPQGYMTNLRGPMFMPYSHMINM